MVYTIGGELYHHGVMGQKWGKRNGPPYPLHPDAHSEREKQFGYKKSIGGGRNEEAYEKNRKKVNKIENKKSVSKTGGSSKSSEEKERSSKKSPDLNSQGSTSPNQGANKKKKYRDKLIDKYKGYGLTDEEAAKAADKKIKAIKGAAIAAGVLTATVAGAVIYQKLGKEYLGKTIKKGTMLNTLTFEKDRTERGQAFYAAVNKGDTLLYRGMFGRAQVSDMQRGFRGNKLNIANVAKENIKVASRDQGRKTLMEMLSNNPSKELVQDLESVVKNTPAHYANANRKTKEAYKSLIKKVYGGGGLKPENLTKNEQKFLYDLYNLNLIDIDKKSRLEFYQNLKKKGFGGVLDINDYKYSGYDAKMPTILFDESKIAKKAAETLTDKQINDARTKNAQRTLMKRLATSPSAIGTAAAAGAIGLKKMSEAYDKNKMRQGAARMTPTERKAALEKQASKYIKRNSYATAEAYKKAKENWVNSQLKKIEKQQGLKRA